MAYDPVTGKWKDEENTSVQDRMTDVLSKDNDYMKQAATRGNQQANRRGLLNSSMGVQAAETARASAALPIASQDSAQAHERNIHGRNIQFQDISQQREIDTRHGLLDKELMSRENLQTANIAAEKERLGMQLTAAEQQSLRELQAAQSRLETELGSRESMQERDIAAMQARLEQELGSREALQAAQAAFDKERLGMQLTQQEQLAMRELEAAQARLETELGSRADLQQADIAFRERLAQLDRDAQERIANLNVEAGDRRFASELAANYEATYSQMVSTIMNNPDIPAAERQRYLDHAAQVRDSNLRLVEQFYSVDLQWESTPTQPGQIPRPGDPGTGPGYRLPGRGR